MNYRRVYEGEGVGGRALKNKDQNVSTNNREQLLKA